ncbi:MAG: RNA-binding protein [Lachnospiraceae bacterium]|nr:RNA-binding protein [Lachnospiraceae bacterium]
MERTEAGMFARSKAGHDKGRLYLIEKTEGEYVYLVDGARRTLAKPKKKKQKHIQVICRIWENWEPETVNDDDIKRAIRQYLAQPAQPEI